VDARYLRRLEKKMKKIKFTFLLLVVSGLLFSCTAKEESELNNKISELTELNTIYQNEISDLQKRISELESVNNNLIEELKKTKINQINLNDESIYENHEINYNIKFDYNGYNIKIYDAPNTDNEIYTLQKGDEIVISNIVQVKETEKVFLKVKLLTNEKYEGFIYLGRNPYKNGDFEPIETLVVDGMKIQTLKLDSSFHVSDGINIKELPSESSKNLHEITHKEGSEYYKSLEITSDYKWVKIQLGDFIGWVPASALSRDIGGPTIYTPEATIYWELIGSNEI